MPVKVVSTVNKARNKKPVNGVLIIALSASYLNLALESRNSVPKKREKKENGVLFDKLR